MAKQCDIDIDFKDRDQILKLIDHVPAARLHEGDLKRHNTSIYIQDIPIDPVSKNAALDYKEAEELGYYKIDFLNLSIYQDVRDEIHLTELVNQEPIWGLLEVKEIVLQLFQLHDHFDLVNKIKPASVEELAMTIALIRPAKRHLIGKPWDIIRKEIWISSEDDSYAFKKSHSFSYAMAIIVQMNLITENMERQLIADQAIPKVSLNDIDPIEDNNPLIH